VTEHTLAVVFSPSSSMTLRILGLEEDVLSRSAFTGTTISEEGASAIEGAMVCSQKIKKCENWNRLTFIPLNLQHRSIAYIGFL